MTCINLIPAHRIERRMFRVRLRRWCAGCTIYCVVAWSVCVAYTAAYDRTGDDLGRGIATTAIQITEVNDAIASVQLQLSEAERKLNASRAVTLQPDWSVLLALLADSRGKNVVLNFCQVQEVVTAGVGTAPEDSGFRSFKVLVRGLGETQSAVSHFVLQIEKLGLFDRVTMMNVNRVTVRDCEAVTFELACVLGGRVEHANANR